MLMLAVAAWSTLNACSGKVKTQEKKEVPKGNATHVIEEVIDAQSPRPASEAQKSIKSGEIPQMVEAHRHWLSATGLGFVLGTNESFQRLQELPQNPTPGPSKDDLFSFSVTINNTQHKWTLRQGGDLSILCGRVAENLKAEDLKNDAGPAEHASARLRLMRASDSNGSLHGVDLDCADLHHSSFFHTDLANTSFIGADLRSAYFHGSDLSAVNFRGADLRGAKFWQCDLSNAILAEADLTGASFASETNMKLVNADFAQFDSVQFDAKDASNMSIIGAKGLSKIIFMQPNSAVELRSHAKELGLREQERDLTSAIHKWQALRDSEMTRFFDAYIAGGKLTDYGANPWRSILAMLLLIPVFALMYVGSLEFRRTRLILTVTAKKGKAKSILWRRTHPLTRPGKWSSRIFTQGRIFRIAFYLSLINAFRFGWHEFNIGSWISGLQRHDYTLRPTGWLRTIAGIQSVSSLYLLAVWAITLFSNPF